MAQTKRKRRSKHRGNAAGTIQSRGRTGRPPTAEERKKQTRESAKEKRLNTPPTWKAATTRAGMAALILFAFLLFTTKGSARILVAVGVGLVAFVAYIPFGYYLELFLYRRRQSRRETPRDKEPTK